MQRKKPDNEQKYQLQTTNSLIQSSKQFKHSGIMKQNINLKIQAGQTQEVHESLNTVITKRIWQRQGTEEGLNTQITGLQRRRGSDVPPIMTPDSAV